MRPLARFAVAVQAVVAVLALVPAAPALAATSPSPKPVTTHRTNLKYTTPPKRPHPKACHCTPAPKRPHPKRKPWPVTVTVQTVPALAGVHFTFDGTVLTTDPNGTASFTAEHNFTKHALALVDTAIDQPTRRYRFSRWAGQRDPAQAFRASVTDLPMRANYTVTAAFSVQYPVRTTLVDQHGTPLDLADVSDVTVKNDAGQLQRLPKDGTIWLDGTVPGYRKSQLVEDPVYYSVQTLMMSGTNIVDSGKQRFTPADAPSVTVTGQLHDLTVTARDVLFGTPLGTRAVVTGPDGAVETVPFDATHTAVLRNMPRGGYHVSVAGVRGLALDEQVGLSRDQALQMAVVSPGDLAAVGGALLLVATVLLFVGRRWLRRPFVRLVRALTRLVRPRSGTEVAA